MLARLEPDLSWSAALEKPGTHIYKVKKMPWIWSVKRRKPSRFLLSEGGCEIIAVLLYVFMCSCMYWLLLLVWVTWEQKYYWVIGSCGGFFFFFSPTLLYQTTCTCMWPWDNEQTTCVFMQQLQHLDVASLFPLSCGLEKCWRKAGAVIRAWLPGTDYSPFNKASAWIEAR